MNENKESQKSLNEEILNLCLQILSTKTPKKTVSLKPVFIEEEDLKKEEEEVYKIEYLITSQDYTLESEKDPLISILEKEEN